jgi:hypothetical protein
MVIGVDLHTLSSVPISAIFGALFIYCMNMRRNKRVEAIYKHFNENWRMLIFDIVVFVVLGLIFVLYAISPQTSREAFLAGATWDATALALLDKTGTARGAKS